MCLLPGKWLDVSLPDKDVHVSHCNAAKDDGTVLCCQIVPKCANWHSRKVLSNDASTLSLKDETRTIQKIIHKSSSFALELTPPPQKKPKKQCKLCAAVEMLMDRSP